MIESYQASGHSIENLRHPMGVGGAVSSFTNVDRMMQH
jgi:hypothetical protein